MNGVRNYAGTGAKDFNEDNGLVEKVYNQAENPARKHCGGNYTGIGDSGGGCREEGKDNNLLELIAADPEFNLTLEQLQATMEPSKYVG